MKKSVIAADAQKKLTGLELKQKAAKRGAVQRTT